MLLTDSYEPKHLTRLLGQSVPVVSAPLNQTHRSDYFFGNYEGKTFQFSRKQMGELVGDIDEAERQLADYYPNADYNFQIVEGLFNNLPIHGVGVSDHSRSTGSARDIGNKIYTYSIQPDGHIDRGHSFSTINDSILYAWLHRLAMAGIPTYITPNWVGTARLLAVLYRNEQKPPEEHSTLKRIIRPRMAVADESKMSDAQLADHRLMKALLFLSSTYKLGIGEKKAKAIIEGYVSLMDIAMADVAELAQCEGIGKTIAKKLLIALGRQFDEG